MSNVIRYVPNHDWWPSSFGPDYVEVFDVDRDTNGRRPYVRVFTPRPATRRPDQRYYDVITDEELDRLYLPAPDTQEPPK